MTAQAVGSVDSRFRRPRSEFQRGWVRFSKHGLAVTGLVFIAILVLLALLAPLIAPYSYTEQNLVDRMQPPFSSGHLLGTDELGRDVLSRLLFSLRTALMIGFGAEALALAVALVIGLWAGYRGGRVDQTLMAFVDVMFAFPTYLFAVLLVVVLGRSPMSIVIAIGVASWVSQARLVRAQVLRLKNFEFVESARAIGTPATSIVVRHILPLAVGPLLVATSFGIPAAIIAESGLALLGLGVAPPTPSWGGMILDGYTYVLSSPYLIAAPVALLALTTLAFTWVGDGLRDAFDSNEEVGL